MHTIRLLDLGDVSPLRSQTVYHAAAYAMSEDTADTILLVSPTQPYVSIGYHQELEKEVDLDTCRQRDLPIIRREVGGGAVYLDHGQLFVQWVFHPGHLPEKIEDRFALYVRPIVETYHELGIDAEYRPINDIHVNGRKICGTGAATIGNAEVVVGSFMFHFDKETMSKVLRVSSEKMRDKVFQSLQQYMTTIEELLGYQPSRDLVKQIYLEKAAKLLDAEIHPAEWTAEEEAQACEVDARFQSEEWLNQRGGLRQTGIKIHQDAPAGPHRRYRAVGRLHPHPCVRAGLARTVAAGRHRLAGCTLGARAAGLPGHRHPIARAGARALRPGDPGRGRCGAIDAGWRRRLETAA